MLRAHDDRRLAAVLEPAVLELSGLLAAGLGTYTASSALSMASAVELEEVLNALCQPAEASDQQPAVALRGGNPSALARPVIPRDERKQQAIAESSSVKLLRGFLQLRRSVEAVAALKHGTSQEVRMRKRRHGAWSSVSCARLFFSCSSQCMCEDSAIVAAHADVCFAAFHTGCGLGRREGCDHGPRSRRMRTSGAHPDAPVPHHPLPRGARARLLARGRAGALALAYRLPDCAAGFVSGARIECRDPCPAHQGRTACFDQSSGAEQCVRKLTNSHIG